jgi:outer membrane receptor protein involved in Fe transport
LQLWHKQTPPPAVSSPPAFPADPSTINAALSAAARAHASGVEVEAAGRVIRLLPEDTKGARHQRFLVRVADSLTILVTHNRDLAPRVPVQPGDSVTLRGEYIWNERGGMIHWTHHDPAHRHEPGWVEYHGRRYE